MEIKGELGQEVLVRAKINSVNVSPEGAVYQLGNKWMVDIKDHSIIVKEEDIIFQDEKPKKASAPKKKEEPAAAPKKRPGRPKKATVEGTMAKYEEMINRAKSMDAGLKG